MIAAVFGILCYLWVFWGLYVLIMGVYRAHLAGRLTKTTLVLSLPFLALGYLVDIIANIAIASIVFFELPKEFLVTTRLQRYNRTGTGWRKSLATWICDNLLDVFDPTGSHC